MWQKNAKNRFLDDFWPSKNPVEPVNSIFAKKTSWAGSTRFFKLKKNWVEPAQLDFLKKNWLSRLNPDFWKKVGWAGSTRIFGKECKMTSSTRIFDRKFTWNSIAKWTPECWLDFSMILTKVSDSDTRGYSSFESHFSSSITWIQPETQFESGVFIDNW